MVLKDLSLLMIKRGNKLNCLTVQYLFSYYTLASTEKAWLLLKEPRGSDLELLEQAKIFCRGLWTDLLGITAEWT